MIKRFLGLAALVVGVTTWGGAQDISGDWQGPLTTSMGELRLVVHVTKQADGTYKGTMDSPDQAIMGAALDTITLGGSKVHFTLNVAKGVFDGSLKGNGSITGNWVQGTNSPKMPLTLSRTTTPLKMEHAVAPPSDIDGTWNGLYSVPTASVSEKKQVTFQIKNTADGLTASFDLPEMSAKGWPVTEVARKGNSIKIRIKQFNVLVQVKLNKTLDNMTGDWIQGDEPARAFNAKKTQGTTAAGETKADVAKQ